METNTGVAVVGIAGTLFCVCALVFLFVKGRRHRAAPYLAFAAGALFVWHLFNTLFYVWPHIQTAAVLHNYKYLGACFAPVAFLFCAYAMTGQLQRCRMRNILALCVVPAICALAAITNPWHGLFFTGSHLVEAPVRIMENERGILFYLYLLYGYIMGIYTLLYALLCYRHAPLRYDKKYAWVAAAGAVPLVSSVFVVSGVIKANYEVMLMAGVFSLCILLWLEFFGGQGGFAFTRDMVFEGLSDPIVVLDGQGGVVDMNKNARKLLPGLAGKRNLAYNEWMAELVVQGGYKVEKENEDTFLVGPLHTLKVKRTPILLPGGEAAGLYLELVDNTAERLLLQQMQRMASTDALTGLYNRSRYERELARLENLPGLSFGCMVIDINGLKYVNDHYGHNAGDELIASVGALLRRALPQKAFAARIGGDEFAVILEQVSEKELERYRQAILLAVENTPKIRGWKVNIALGCAMRSQGEHAQAVVNVADAAMYKGKQDFYEKAGHNRRRESERA